MRCYICDRVIDEPNFNSLHGDYDPCEPCLAVINDLLDSDKSNASAAEDDLLDEQTWVKEVLPDEDEPTEET